MLRYVAFLEVRPEELEDFIETWTARTLTDDRVKMVLSPHVSADAVNGISSFVVFESDDFQAVEEYLRRFEAAGARVRLMPAWEDSFLAKELTAFQEGKAKTTLEWENTHVERISNLGSTKSLEILPLLDWHKGREDLKVENGVSYLVRTDEATVLFDLGQNSKQSDPSPLAHNMKALGIGTDDFDTIVISHNHGDHVGGIRWQRLKTFSIDATRQEDLGKKNVYTPMPMTYPGLNPIYSQKPTVISNGVATIGAISSYLFRTMDQMGYVSEQALAVNVTGKGIVLIVGCGHQTVPRIIERTEALFNEPIYGLVGGLHYPVRGGPKAVMGMYYHQYMGTWKVPWQPVTKRELEENINLVKRRNPKIIGLSPHDSSEFSLATFRASFPNEYRDVKVGQSIHV